MNIKSLFITMLFMVLTSCSLLFNSYKSHIDDVYIPKDLEDAIEQLNISFSDSLKNNIKNLTETQFTAEYHFGTGLAIRNNWNLWQGSRLSHYFHRKGIKHPDDMSGIILTSFHRQLTGKDIDLDGQIKNYKQYNKESKRINKLVKLPSESHYPEKNLVFGYQIGYRTQDGHSLIHIQTNSTSDSLWIYDYLYGWLKIHKDFGEKLKSTNKYSPDSLMKTINKKK
jgi:hypothetical protein